MPKDQRLQAIKAAIMLLPDENREVLQTLLYFLSDVTAAVKENQMTPTNLAVCLAPSLFHLNTLKRENSSPRYRSEDMCLHTLSFWGCPRVLVGFIPESSQKEWDLLPFFTAHAPLLPSSFLSSQLSGCDFLDNLVTTRFGERDQDLCFSMGDV